MKKICFVTTVSSTICAFLLPTLQYLKENTDWELTVMCDDDPKLQPLLPEGVQYIPVSMKRGISFAGIGAILKMRRIFKKEKFDLVQFSTPNASLYASVAAKMAGIPVRLYCQWGIAYVGFAGMKRKLFKEIEKLVCSLSTWVEPDSFGNLEFCRSQGLYKKEKSSVIWNGSASGVCLEKFDISQKELWRQEIRKKLSIPDDEFVFGFVGRVNPDKGVNELFSAFQRLLQSHPDSHLIIVGPVERKETLNQSLYQWAQENSRVVFCGFTSQVERYISAMDSYILPSYREGFGSSVIEAEAMGVPVIITDIPGPTDAMEANKTGLVVPKADADALYEAMHQMIGQPELRKKFGKEAQLFATARFDQKQLMAHILEDRKRLMNDGR